MKRILTTASAALLAFGTAASASTFSLMDETPGIIPGGATNEVLTNTFGLGGAGGYFGAEVYLDSMANVEVAAFGFEAGFTNSFTMGGNTITTTDLEGITGPAGDDEEFATDLATPLASFTVANVAAGLLNFSFLTDGLGGVQVDNGSNPDNSASNPNFFVSFGKGTRDTIFLFFDDGGAGNDDNHDDLVIRLRTGNNNPEPNPVPLPATGLLLLGALGGMRMMKRRS